MSLAMRVISKITHRSKSSRKPFKCCQHLNYSHGTFNIGHETNKSINFEQIILLVLKESDIDEREFFSMLAKRLKGLRCIKIS